MAKKHVVILLVLSFFVSLAGCANYGASSYSGEEARTAQTVRYGTVVSVQPVKLESNQTGDLLGAAGGAVVGGILGNLVGGGKGRTAATVGGALGGAALGYGGTKMLTGQDGLEIQVKLDSGENISVVQGADQMFTPGEKVRVLISSTGVTRVTR